MTEVQHEGASPSWSPREELDRAGQSPELSRPTEREAATDLHADLVAIEVRAHRALANVIAVALARLGQAES
jgi:hypothetical protein